jgi:hypothetical protein
MGIKKVGSGQWAVGSLSTFNLQLFNLKPSTLNLQP